MATRLDLALQKYPQHEEGLRLLASRDPSGGRRAAMLDRAAKRTRKKARTLARNLAEQKRRKGAALKKSSKAKKPARVPVRRS